MDNIAAGASLEFDAATSSGQTVTFAADTGNLAIGAPSSFAALIAGFGAGNEIDLFNTNATAASYQSGVLTVKNGTTTVASLNLFGNYSGTTAFEVATDGDGGSHSHNWIPTGYNRKTSGNLELAEIGEQRASWNPNAAPNGATAVATISVPGTYTVTIANGETFAIGTLTLNNPSATLDVLGTLSISNTLILDGGTAAVSGLIDGAVMQTECR